MPHDRRGIVYPEGARADAACRSVYPHVPRESPAAGRRPIAPIVGGAAMWRRVFCAVVVLAFGVSIGLADEIRVVLLKVDGDKVTFAEYKGKGEKGEAKTLPVAKDLKVSKGKLNEATKKLDAGDAIEQGLRNAMFTKIDEKGMRATIITDADNKMITEIRVGGGKKQGG